MAKQVTNKVVGKAKTAVKSSKKQPKKVVLTPFSKRFIEAFDDVGLKRRLHNYEIVEAIFAKAKLPTNRFTTKGYINYIKNKGIRVKPEVARAFCEIYQVRYAWLEKGELPMYGKEDDLFRIKSSIELKVEQMVLNQRMFMEDNMEVLQGKKSLPVHIIVDSSGMFLPNYIPQGRSNEFIQKHDDYEFNKNLPHKVEGINDKPFTVFDLPSDVRKAKLICTAVQDKTNPDPTKLYVLVTGYEIICGKLTPHLSSGTLISKPLYSITQKQIPFLEIREMYLVEALLDFDFHIG